MHLLGFHSALRQVRQSLAKEWRAAGVGQNRSGIPEGKDQVVAPEGFPPPSLILFRIKVWPSYSEGSCFYRAQLSTTEATKCALSGGKTTMLFAR